MLAQPLIEAVLNLIFVKMKTIYNTSVEKRQRDFLCELFRTIFALRGRVNFTNMARFSSLHEHTFQIVELLSLHVDPDTDRSEVKQRAEAKLVDIEEKIRDLERMKHALAVLAEACSGCGPTSECPILEGMQSAEAFDDAIH